ncbi:MAG: ABC transporter ATP-binding protein [Rhodospirillaceae bacterium]|nr:MAG: ABC transporter ATP-binding protein [Rhodospirillaceae bacterium]
MSAQAPLVNIRNLVKHFGSVAAVDDVSLQVGEGEFLTFLGSSGSGKTTTLFIVAGFEDPTAGDVEIDGRSVLSVKPNERNIGMVFQRYTLFPHMTVAQNVGFPLMVRRRSKAEIDKAVKEMLDLVQLGAYAGRKPSELSGGQQQRVALARALVYKPRILLMDEPLAALDKRLREDIQQEIRRIHRELGVTILYVTHDQEEALRMSDRIAVFSHGKIAQIGSGADLYERPADAFVAGFIGNSNFLQGSVVQSQQDQVAVRLDDGTVIRGNTRHPLAANARVRLMIRPERLALAPSNDQVDQSLDVTLSDTTYLGDMLQHEVVTAWQQRITVRTNDRAAASSAGNALKLHFASTDVMVFEDGNRATA